SVSCFYSFFFQAEDGIRYPLVTGVQTCALPILTKVTEGAIVQPPNGSRLSCGRDGTWHTVWLSASSRAPWRTNRTLSRRPPAARSEERRVGKECRSRWWTYHKREKKNESL